MSADGRCRSCSVSGVRARYEVYNTSFLRRVRELHDNSSIETSYTLYVRAGFGVNQLGGVPLYGEKTPGLCQACQVEGCLDCLNYYKRCERCATGYGPSVLYSKSKRRSLLQTSVDERYDTLTYTYGGGIFTYVVVPSGAPSSAYDSSYGGDDSEDGGYDTYTYAYGGGIITYEDVPSGADAAAPSGAYDSSYGGDDFEDGETADYVESNSFVSCTKCSEDRCGICQEVYTKCNGYYSDCDKAVARVESASNAGVNNIEKCEGEPSFAGNGYVSKRVYTIVDGDCAECGSGSVGNTWYWYPADDADGEMATYCWMDGQMRSVAANAFDESDGCKYPAGITLELTNLCYSNNRGVQFDVYGTFKGSYCGITKTIYVYGESIFGPVWEELGKSDAITWSYAATEGSVTPASSSESSPTSSSSPSNATGKSDAAARSIMPASILMALVATILAAL